MEFETNLVKISSSSRSVSMFRACVEFNSLCMPVYLQHCFQILSLRSLNVTKIKGSHHQIRILSRVVNGWLSVIRVFKYRNL